MFINWTPPINKDSCTINILKIEEMEEFKYFQEKEKENVYELKIPSLDHI